MKKADNVHRVIAKVIDLALVGILARLLGVVGLITGVIYILICDGLFGGQSIGKKLVGLRVILTEKKGARTYASFRESIIRNLPYAIVIGPGAIPIVGWFIILPLGMVFLLVEAYFVYADDRGIRIGDMYAGTQVIDESPPSS